MAAKKKSKKKPGRKKVSAKVRSKIVKATKTKAARAVTRKKPKRKTAKKIVKKTSQRSAKKTVLKKSKKAVKKTAKVAVTKVVTRKKAPAVAEVAEKKIEPMAGIAPEPAPAPEAIKVEEEIKTGEQPKIEEPREFEEQMEIEGHPETMASRKELPLDAASAPVKPPHFPWREPLPNEVLVGTVEDYLTHLEVMIVRLHSQMEIGDNLHIRGCTTDFKHCVNSLQLDHAAVSQASAGQTVGIKVEEKVRKHDQIYKIIA